MKATIGAILVSAVLYVAAVAIHGWMIPTIAFGLIWSGLLAGVSIAALLDESDE